MDYRDGDQKKWLPWFNVLSPAGVSFNDTNYEYSNANDFTDYLGE